jgi:oligoendopeptidase F
MGVSLVDQYMWKWLYEHPQANAAELKDAVNAIAIDVWNKYYAPVFGVKDQPVLAIYSHMVNSPIYLSNYAFGHLIQFQVEQYLKNSHFATEVERLFALGKLTPGQWMQQGVGGPISTDALIDATSKAVETVRL